MQWKGICPISPEYKYIDSFPKEYQSSISDLNGFIGMVRKKQESLPKYYILS